MFDMSPEELSGALNSAIEGVANLSDSDSITTANKGTFDDRYAVHSFTYTADYVVGIPGRPTGFTGGPPLG